MPGPVNMYKRKGFMSWVYLVMAGLLEIVWAVGLKYTEGFTKWLPSTITVAAMWVSFWFLSIALKEIPMSTAYAVWTGIGIVGTAFVGIGWFGESADALKIICICLILAGIIGLKLI